MEQARREDPVVGDPERQRVTGKVQRVIDVRNVAALSLLPFMCLSGEINGLE